MIPRPRIAYWLALFGERMGRQLADATFREYAAAFDRLELAPDDFERAAVHLFAVERFLPPPLEFLYAAHPDRRPERAAVLALQAIREARNWQLNPGAGNASGWTVIRWTDVPEEFRAIAREAYELAGGTVDLLEPATDYGFARRFAEVYKARAEAEALPTLRTAPEAAGSLAGGRGGPPARISAGELRPSGRPHA